MSLYKTRRAFLSFIKKQPKEDQPEWRRLLDSVLFREDLEPIIEGGDIVEAEDVGVTTTNFGDNLSSADDTVQKALDTLDDHIHDATEVTADTSNFGTNGIGLSASENTVQKFMDAVDDWIPDHTTDLSNVGSNTHAQIDAFITNQNAIIAAQEEPTGFEDTTNTDSSIAFDNNTRTFTISDATGGTGYYYWQTGTRYNNTSDKTVVIADTEGGHYIYFDGNTLAETTTFSDDILSDYTYVAYIQWDATNNQQILMGDERHGLMPWQIHSLWHLTFGTVLTNGGGLSGITADGDGSSDSHAEFTIDATDIRDEDIYFSHSSQASTATKIYYKLGAAGDWRIAGDGPIHLDTGVPQYNQFTGGAWQLTGVGNAKLFLMHVLATNDRTRKYAIIMGENEYGTLTEARDGADDELAALQLGGLPSEEFAFLGTLIYQYNSSYSNTYSTRARSTAEGDDYVDWRQAEIGPGTGPTSHPDLVNRGLANQHPASAISTSVTNFNTALSASDTDVQTALETLDDIVVLNTGDTMTGNLEINVVGSAELNLDSDPAPGVASDWSIIADGTTGFLDIVDNTNSATPISIDQGAGIDGAVTITAAGVAIEGTLFSSGAADVSVSMEVGVGPAFIVEAGGDANTLVVDNNSRVGIKTASPSYDLDVQGTAAIGTNAQFLVEAGAAANTLVVDSNSRVGIGTASPSVHLTAENTTADADPATSGTAQSGAVLRLDGSGATVLDFGINASAGRTWIQGASQTDLSTNRILLLNPNGGNVGIATSTTAPAAGFDVKTNMLAGNNAQFVVENGASANTLVVDSNSRVGIGTASPDEALHISAASARFKLTNTDATTDYWIVGLNPSEQFVFNWKGDATAELLITQDGDLRFPGFLEFGSGGPIITKYAGSPEGNVTADPGSICMNTSGGANTSLYVKESGTGNTGWVAK